MAENKKTALFEGVGRGRTSAVVTTTKDGADPAHLTFNIVVNGEVKTFYYIETNSNEVVTVERGKCYIVIVDTFLPYYPLWWLNRSFGKDSDFIAYTAQHYDSIQAESVDGDFHCNGLGRFANLTFKVKDTARLGDHPLYFSNNGMSNSYTVWNDDAYRLDDVHIQGKKIITLKVV